MNSLHVVMYHYVRHIKSRFPSLKMRLFEDFCRQLDYLQNNFNIVTMENVIDAVHGETELQENSCLLTFDDGYQEHFTEVFPELFRRGLSGAFYPPVCAISREHLLEVNKIQLILALNESRLNDILYEIKQIYVSEHKNRTPCFDKPYDAVWDNYAKSDRFDTKEVVFIKSLCQFALPQLWRTKLIDRLYSKFVDVDETVAANEYYMSIDMLRIMANNGMHIGSHGAKHLWLDKLTNEEQKEEIDASLDMIDKIYNAKKIFWTICYPYGATNDQLQDMCKERGCVMGFTTEPKVANVLHDDIMRLPRMDTNDYPLK